MAKEKLFGKKPDELQLIVKEFGLPRYTARQIAGWLYNKNVTSFNDMSDLSKPARQLLKENFEFGLSEHSRVMVSVDGTKKYLFPVADDKFVEAVYIPEKKRNTLCVSTQVGCEMNCIFCMTGKQGFQANLTAGDILNQVRSLPERDKLTNIVYMGMGEPMNNLQAVLDSLEILTSDRGFNISPQKITVSTVGILPAMKDFIDSSPCHLAVSLNTPFDEERRRLMPVENLHPLKNVLFTIKQYDFNRQRRVSFEYIMLKGLNDTERHVKELVRILHGIKCRVNLVRFHPFPGTSLQGSDDNTIEHFKNMLKTKGIIATIRASRGQDIFAACGLLSTKNNHHHSNTLPNL
jgi:23S rRNA (adenine2503-C2)-methyltransferase